MAQSSDNLFTEGFRGTVGGNMTFRRKKSGKMVVSKCRGASTVPPTAAQQVTNSRFKRAVVYAKAVIKNAVLKLMYSNAAKDDQSAFNVATKDAFIAPTVTDINKSGYKGLVNDKIYVQATDDFQVKSVKVSISNSAGDLIEEGNAVLEVDGLSWLYTSTVANNDVIDSVIKATALDHAGNEGSLEVTV